jgi:tetratricopeptide (TPR) repeat protein
MNFYNKSFYIVGLILALSAIYNPTKAQAQDASASTITPAEMRTLAANAVVSGAPRQGYQLASALLERNPNDTEALIIRARAARDLGRLDEAMATARKAWNGSSTPSERFGASMVMAQALSTSGAKTRAQLWLRRAAQNAPNENFKDIAFRYVQRTNPWSTELSFAAAPSSNVNNGSARSTTRLFDLPFEFQLSGTARALSGIQYNAGFATRYRIAESQSSQSDLLFRFDHRTYTLSNEAKLLAPTAKGSDFAFTSASLSYIRRGFTGSGIDLPNQFELTGGRTWYAQQPFMQYARIGFTQNYVFAPGSFVFGGVSAERQQSLSAREDANSWGLNTGVRFSLANKDRLTLSVNAKRSQSLDANLDYDQLTLSARYALAKPIAGVSVDFGVSLGQKNHDISRFSRFGRQDKTASFDVTGVFNQIEVYGFSPSVTLTARQTNSNIGLFETRDFGLRVGIQSAF